MTPFRLHGRSVCVWMSSSPGSAPKTKYKSDRHEETAKHKQFSNLIKQPENLQRDLGVAKCWKYTTLETVTKFECGGLR